MLVECLEQSDGCFTPPGVSLGDVFDGIRQVDVLTDEVFDDPLIEIALVDHAGEKAAFLLAHMRSQDLNDAAEKIPGALLRAVPQCASQLGSERGKS